MKPFLSIERSDGVMTLTMSQPETRNALTGNSAISELVQACADMAEDRSIRVAILTGDGTVFSSGGNLKDMQRFASGGLSPDEVQIEYLKGIQRIPKAFNALDVPIIAAVNGAAIGAGFDLTCMCDIRIASERATFAESFVKLGIVSGDGGAWFLPRIVGRSKAAEIALTGDSLNAAQALECGLVSRVVRHDDLMSVSRALALRIAANPTGAVRMTKRLLRQSESSTLDALLETSAAYQAIAHTTPEYAAAVAKFLDKKSTR
jgi:enoyl-CoA hydratase/carnithine racemase